jgi:hypothetical protein
VSPSVGKATREEGHEARSKEGPLSSPLLGNIKPIEHHATTRWSTTPLDPHNLLLRPFQNMFRIIFSESETLNLTKYIAKKYRYPRYHMYIRTYTKSYEGVHTNPTPHKHLRKRLSQETDSIGLEIDEVITGASLTGSSPLTKKNRLFMRY